MVLGQRKQLSDNRLVECRSCDKNAGGLCVLCGCIVKAKTRVVEEQCPEGVVNYSE